MIHSNCPSLTKKKLNCKFKFAEKMFHLQIADHLVKGRKVEGERQKELISYKFFK